MCKMQGFMVFHFVLLERHRCCFAAKGELTLCFQCDYRRRVAYCKMYCWPLLFSLRNPCLQICILIKILLSALSAPTCPGCVPLGARNQDIPLTGLATNLSTAGTEVPGQFTCARQGCPNRVSRSLQAYKQFKMTDFFKIA